MKVLAHWAASEAKPPVSAPHIANGPSAAPKCEIAGDRKWQVTSHRRFLAKGWVDPILSLVMLRARRRKIAEDRRSGQRLWSAELIILPN